MGADSFMQFAIGKDAAEAFGKAVESAQYDYGHRGYTGTIAEKEGFIKIPFSRETNGDPQKYAAKLISDGDQRIDDKWGPAGCFDLGPIDHGGNHRYLFFGWASS